jgi:hypothetical protein
MTAVSRDTTGAAVNRYPMTHDDPCQLPSTTEAWEGPPRGVPGASNQRPWGMEARVEVCQEIGR